MIWLAWRQFRLSALAVLGTLAVFAAALAISGPQLAELFRESQASFFELLEFDDFKKAVFVVGTALVYAVPAVVGVFWGAPLVAREFEAGTHRLVWTQSVTRTHWLGTKLGMAAIAALAAGLLGLLLTWWSGAIDDAIAAGYSSDTLMGMPRITPVLFGARGFLPAGLTLLALAIGVTASLVIRRSVVAMATTLVVMVGVQVSLAVLVQPNLLEPRVELQSFSLETLDGDMAGGPAAVVATFKQIDVKLDQPGAWMLSQTTVDASGSAVDEFPSWTSDCVGQRDAMAGCMARLTTEGYRQRVSYLPASDFWTLQLVETGIVLGLAAGLTGFCFWRIRRDLT